MPIADPLQEEQRLEALRRTELLDTGPEPEFDELVKIAASICGAPMGLVTLVDEHRQWFKAALGVEMTETSRELSFCVYTIQQDDLFAIEDATQDPRFCRNELVTGDSGIRFYAGFPISSPDGYRLGSLCVLDHKPHRLNETQQSALRTIARQVNAQIELRMHRRQLQRALAEAEEAQRQVEASDRRFKAFMDSAPFLTYLKDSVGTLLFYNQPFAEHFGIGAREWLGCRSHESHSSEFAELVRGHDLQVLASGKPHVFLEPSHNEDGSVSQWRSYKFPCLEPDGTLLLGGISVDVTAEFDREAELRRSKEELEEANRLLSELAATDSLTKLANRRIFDERLDLEYARARRKKRSLAVLMIDVDNFKQHNDAYGHAHGDQVLLGLAKCLTRSIRESDLAARYGGEEFVILLPECNEEEALSMAQRIMRCIREEPCEHEPITVSMGAASLDDATPNPQRLVILADEALYAAKHAGKDRALGYRAYYQAMIAELKTQHRNTNA